MLLLKDIEDIDVFMKKSEKVDFFLKGILLCKRRQNGDNFMFYIVKKKDIFVEFVYSQKIK